MSQVVNLFNDPNRRARSEFITSSEIYKRLEAKEKRKAKKKMLQGDENDEGVSEKTKLSLNAKEKRHMAFVNELSKYTSCVSYIEDIMKTSNNKLEKKYNFISVISELAEINNFHKIDFLRTKLFEILLTLGFTDRVSVLFNDDPASKCLREIWYHNKDYDKTTLKNVNLESFVNNDFDEEVLIKHELKRGGIV